MSFFTRVRNAITSVAAPIAQVSLAPVSGGASLVSKQTAVDAVNTVIKPVAQIALAPVSGGVSLAQNTQQAKSILEADTFALGAVAVPSVGAAVKGAATGAALSRFMPGRRPAPAPPPLTAPSYELANPTINPPPATSSANPTFVNVAPATAAPAGTGMDGKGLLGIALIAAPIAIALFKG